MLADKLINCLDGVKETGNNRWVARCPSHEDKSPSLAVTEKDDRVLVHCFAGCSVQEVISAAGLDLTDLFPEREKNNNRKISRPFPAGDVLKCLSNEINFLMVCASDLAKGEKIDTQTHDRLLKSASRFRSALKAGGL